MATKRSPAPLFHAATKRVRDELYDTYHRFLGVFREATERWRRGDLGAAHSGTAKPCGRSGQQTFLVLPAAIQDIEQRIDRPRLSRGVPLADFVRQILAESLLLGLAGAVLGLLIARLARPLVPLLQLPVIDAGSPGRPLAHRPRAHTALRRRAD